MISSLLTLIVVLLFATNAIAHEKPLSDVVRQYRQSVIFIKVEKVNPVNGAITEEGGTGFVVHKDGFVITSGHVVGGGAGIQVDVRGSPGSREGYLEGMEVIFESSNLDVAVLRFKNTSIERKPISLGDPWAVSDSATVYSMGFPGKEEWFHTEGKLSGKVGPKGSWNTTMVLNPGMSGGPVFDTDGRVVAIVWGGVPTPGVAGINRILPINLLAEPLRISGLATESTGSVSPPTPSPTRGIEVPYKVDQGQETMGGLQAESRDYQQTFQALPGHKIVDYNFVAKSSNNASVEGIQLSPDGKTLSMVFSLRSGPIFDRWRGWLDGDLLTRQEKE
jgi:S1-C subfamily serine protease